MLATVAAALALVSLDTQNVPVRDFAHLHVHLSASEQKVILLRRAE